MTTPRRLPADDPASSARIFPRLKRSLQAADRPASRSLPLADLVQATHCRSALMLAARCGVHERTVQDWRVTGRIPLLTADRVATAAGLDPLYVWGREWTVQNLFQALETFRWRRRWGLQVDEYHEEQVA
jgi:hypothetical protein